MSQANPPYQPPPGSVPPPPGQPYGGAAPYPPGHQKTSSAAVASLVFGILSCIPFVGVIAAILGIVGLTKTSNPQVRGRGLAIAGLVLGLLGVVWSLMFAISGVGIFAMFKATGPARDQARAFIQDLDAGNASAAIARCTGDIDQAELQRDIKYMKDWGGVKSITFPPVGAIHAEAGKPTTADVAGAVEFGKLHKTFTATLVKEGETFKIQTYKFD